MKAICRYQLNHWLFLVCILALSQNILTFCCFYVIKLIYRLLYGRSFEAISDMEDKLFSTSSWKAALTQNILQLLLFFCRVRLMHAMHRLF